MRVKKVILLILWAVFTFAAPIGLIAAEFIVADSWGYRLSLGGLVIIVALCFVFKSLFLKGYQNKMNDLLQELASTPYDSQEGIISRIKKHKVIFHAISVIDSTLPLLVLMLATSFLGQFLSDMGGVIGWVWLSVMIGAVFGIWRRLLPRRGK